jgi:hypothetical protein
MLFLSLFKPFRCNEELDHVFAQVQLAAERIAAQVRITALNFVPLI